MKEFMQTFNHLPNHKIVFQSMDYPLAPENVYPAPQQACFNALERLLEQVPASNILIAGDSAGGAYALYCALKYKEKYPLQEQLAGISLVSPWVSYSIDMQGSHGKYESVEYVCASWGDVSNVYMGCYYMLSLQMYYTSFMYNHEGSYQILLTYPFVQLHRWRKPPRRIHQSTPRPWPSLDVACNRRSLVGV